MLVNGFVPEQQVVDLGEGEAEGEENAEEQGPTPLAFPQQIHSQREGEEYQLVTHSNRKRKCQGRND